MARISIAEAKKMGIDIPEDLARKNRKYNNKKPVIDGIKFDSQKEADYYCELKLSKRAGEIKDFELQPKFMLQEGFRDKTGKKHRAITYKADFKVIHNDGKVVYIDTKGKRTALYQVKKKMLLNKYPDINFKEE